MTKVTICVSGGLGFIGSNFLNKFVPKNPGIRFINIDCETYAADVNNISREVKKAKNYKFEHIDICDTDALEELFRDNTITHIVNFAAESHVDHSILNPSLFVETNVLGTQNLLDMAIKHKTFRFLQISTDEVYGSLSYTDDPWTEESPLKPNSPYAASKAAAELMVLAAHRTFGLNVGITRSSNNFGPNQDDSKLIPKFISLISSGKKAPLMGKGEHIRDWLYVEDNCDGIWEALFKGGAGKIYNLGGGIEMSNLTVAHHIASLAGLDPSDYDSYIEWIPNRKGHDFRYSLDSSFAREDLDWKPRPRWVERLKKTYKWVVKNKKSARR